MATKNATTAKNAVSQTAYRQLDHHVAEVLQMAGSEVLTSPQAWDKYAWTHPYFGEKPTEGYFIWVKEQPSCSFLGCVSLDKPGVKQQLNNLTVIDAGLYVDLTGTCESASLLEEKVLSVADSATHEKIIRVHQAKGKLVLREGASLYYQHIHDWAKTDQISTNYEFFLEKNSSLEYSYKVESAGQVMDLKATMHLAAGARSDLKVLANCEEVNFTLHDTAYLEGAGANAISTLRLVARDGAKVKARSKMLSSVVAKGHLDCGALMLSPDARVELIPEIVAENPEAELTHEASIGKLSAEQILYLRSRGFSEQAAEDLILRGFLSE